VKNCLKHGLAPKLGEGRFNCVRVHHDGRLQIEIEDNGVGISEEKMPHVYVEGIGLVTCENGCMCCTAPILGWICKAGPAKERLSALKCRIDAALEEAATG